MGSPEVWLDADAHALLAEVGRLRAQRDALLGASEEIAGWLGYSEIPYVVEKRFRDAIAQAKGE